MTPMEGTLHHAFWPFSGEGFWSNIRRPPCSPGPLCFSADFRGLVRARPALPRKRGSYRNGALTEIRKRAEYQERKRHININKFFRWLPGWGGGLPTGWPGVSWPVARGQKFMCCVRNPRNINIFVRVPGREDRVSGWEGRWPGWPRNYLCAKCLCAFSGP